MDPSSRVTIRAKIGASLRDAEPRPDLVPADRTLIGKTLHDTYLVEGLLMRTTRSLVFGVQSKVDGRRLAMMTLPGERAGSTVDRERFEREGFALAGIRSPHVVDFVDLLDLPDGRTAILTELLEGEDLGSLLAREGALPAWLALDFARQVCRGLHSVHAQGIVHRDLNPANVFVGRDGEGRPLLKLLDLGAVKLLEAPDMTALGTAVGSPEYMAPEQVTGGTRVDARADVYGVGALLYQMLTGRPSSEARAVGIPADAPAGVAELLGRALADDPLARPRDVGELEGLLLEAAGAPTSSEEDDTRLFSPHHEKAPWVIPPLQEEHTTLRRKGPRLAVGVLAGVVVGSAATALAFYVLPTAGDGFLPSLGISASFGGLAAALVAILLGARR